MDFLQVVLTLTIGILLGLVIAYSYNKTTSSSGDLVITQNEEGEYSYALRLEEEPKGLHSRNRIFFRVKRM